jgi:PAS domain-containing protein
VEIAHDLVDRLPLGIAMFGSDCRLRLSNRQFDEFLGFALSQFLEKPYFDDVLEAARANRRVPEQRDFADWKRTRASLFSTPARSMREIWTLPNGRTWRVSFHPNALGGITFQIEDLTGEFELVRSYNSLLQVQKVTLDAIEDSTAIFGPDGCLRLYNQAFRRLWWLDYGLLLSLPHVSRLSEACAVRFGCDEVWNTIIADINDDEPQHIRGPWAFERPDGRRIILSIKRLPDGGTMTHFKVLMKADRSKRIGYP